MQKHFTVFVCNVSEPAASFQPQLNEEHRAFKWFNLMEAAATANLHPVVALLFRYSRMIVALSCCLSASIFSDRCIKRPGFINSHRRLYAII